MLVCLDMENGEWVVREREGGRGREREIRGKCKVPTSKLYDMLCPCPLELLINWFLDSGV